MPRVGTIKSYTSLPFWYLPIFQTLKKRKNSKSDLKKLLKTSDVDLDKLMNSLLMMCWIKIKVVRSEVREFKGQML